MGKADFLLRTLPQCCSQDTTFKQILPVRMEHPLCTAFCLKLQTVLWGSAFPRSLRETLILQPHRGHINSIAVKSKVPEGSISTISAALTKLGSTLVPKWTFHRFAKKWFCPPSQVPLFSYTRGYKSAWKSVVATPEGAGSGEAEISIAAVTNRVMLLLRLSVVVPESQKCSWSGGCSNRCARQCEDRFLCLYIWPELSTRSAFSCLLLILGANLLCSQCAMGCN